MKVSSVLFLGGARSGKSSLAETFALDLRDGSASKKPIVYLATAEPVDKDFVARIEMHRAQRGPSFVTIEEPISIANAINTAFKASDILVLECLTTWLGNLFHHQGTDNAEYFLSAELKQIASLCGHKESWHHTASFPELRPNGDSRSGTGLMLERLARGDKVLIIVSNELGLGIVPGDAESRLYRDVHGRMNRTVSSFTELVYFTMAGLPVRLK